MSMIPELRIAVASGKGGTGKTLVATNLFHTLRRADIAAKLVDCDAEAPNDALFFDATLQQVVSVTQKVPVIDDTLCSFCGKCHTYCNYNAIFIIPPMQIIKVLEDLCHGCGACLVACEYGAITEKEMKLGKVSDFLVQDNSTLIEARMETGVFSPVAVIKAGIREAGNRNVIIMDSPPGTSCPFIQTVNKADYTVLVTEPTPFGLSDLMQSVETLKTMHKSYGVIVNRGGLGDDKVYEYLESEQIPLLMEIPFDRKIAEICANGDLLTTDHPEWEERFLELFQKIMFEYGNGNHQR